MCMSLRHIDRLGARWESFPPIHLYVNSGGGNVRDTFAIIDCMRSLHSPVITQVEGIAASGAALIAMAGVPGGRVVSPNSIIMIHQVSGGYHGNAKQLDDYKISMDMEMTIMVNHIARCTGRRRDHIRKDLVSDRYFTAEEALEYGSKGLADLIHPEI